MKTNPTYFVSDETRRFLDALNVFQEFENAFLYALTEVYGEQQGEQMYLAHVEQYEAMEDTVWDYMRATITQQMGADKNEVTI